MRKLICAVLVTCLISSYAGTALAAPSKASSQIVVPAGDPMSDEQLDDVNGEFGPIVAGAIAGSIGGAFHYATKPGKKTWRGFGMAVAKGAAWGAVGGAFTLVGMVATGAGSVVSGAATAWSAWGSANAGALKGVSEHF